MNTLYGVNINQYGTVAFKQTDSNVTLCEQFSYQELRKSKYILLSVLKKTPDIKDRNGEYIIHELIKDVNNYGLIQFVFNNLRLTPDIEKKILELTNADGKTTSDLLQGTSLGNIITQPSNSKSSNYISPDNEQLKKDADGQQHTKIKTGDVKSHAKEKDNALNIDQKLTIFGKFKRVFIKPTGQSKQHPEKSCVPNPSEENNVPQSYYGLIKPINQSGIPPMEENPSNKDTMSAAPDILNKLNEVGATVIQVPSGSKITLSGDGSSDVQGTLQGSGQILEPSTSGEQHNEELSPETLFAHYSWFTINEHTPDNLSDIIGSEEIISDLRDNVIIPLQQEGKFLKKNNVTIPNGILIESRTNSTTLIQALVKEIKLPTLEINDINAIGSMLKDIKRRYKYSGKPTIVIARGFDVLTNPDKMSYDNTNDENTFYNTIRNCSEKGMVLIATCANKNSVCEKYRQSGYFDKIYSIKMPTQEERIQYLHRKMPSIEILNNLTNDIDQIANLTEGFAFSDLDQVLSETARKANAENVQASMEIFKNELAEYTKQHGLVPIDDFNRTSNFDTPEFKRIPITDSDPSLEDLSGIDEQKQFLMDKYVKPMQNLEHGINKLGDKALPDGAIFYGPPRNGKTYTAKALAKSLKLPYYEIKLSDVVSELVGVTETTLKKYIMQLVHKFEETGERSVLFLDEFDSLGKNRDNATNYNRDVTDTLLQLLDNPAKYGIIAIAATNHLDDIDPALKGRGRLGNWIQFKNPEYQERYDIIKKELAKFEDTKALAEDDKTVEYLAKEFDGFAIASIVNTLDDVKRKMVYENADFDSAFSISKDETVKRLIGEFCNKTSLKQHEYSYNSFNSLDELSGMEETKRLLKENVIDVWEPEVRKQYIENKCQLPGGVILYGPPGTGKTTIVETLAKQMDVPLFKMDYTTMKGTQYIHQVSKQIVEIFDWLALQAKILKKPVMLFFDEAERFFPNNAERHETEEVNTYKDLMNNASEKGIILIGATNCIDNVDEAISYNERRMGTRIECGNPDKQDREDIFAKQLLALPVVAGLITKEHCKYLAEISEGMSVGNITTTIHKCVISAIKNKEKLDYNKVRTAILTKMKGLRV